MLLKAPAGRGPFSIGGKEITPNAQGLYEADDFSTASALLDAGCTPADQSAAAPLAPNEAALRGAAIEALKLLAVSTPADADDALLAHALLDAVRQAASVRPTT